jgi:hypothetical protein
VLLVHHAAPPLPGLAGVPAFSLSAKLIPLDPGFHSPDCELVTFEGDSLGLGCFVFDDFFFGGLFESLFFFAIGFVWGVSIPGKTVLSEVSISCGVANGCIAVGARVAHVHFLSLALSDDSLMSLSNSVRRN